MRVGLNLTFLAEDSGGSGRYTHEVIPAMLAVDTDLRLTGFVSADAPASIFSAPWSDDVEWVRFPHHPLRRGVVPPILSMGVQWGAIPALAVSRRLDLVHGLAGVVPPLAPRVATVVTVLDLIWLRHPDTMPPRATWGMKIVVPPSARTADRVIAISEATADDLVATLGLPRSKIDVTPLGVRLGTTVEPTPEPELRARLQLGEGPVLLCVAQLRRHKNLGGLIDAVARLGDPSVRLILVGAPTGYERELQELAARRGVDGQLRLPGWISEPDLEGLYRLAACFVLPSFEEGFGLPVLEAMRRQTPVACSATWSLPEVAGDAALLFDPHRPDQIADVIRRILADSELRRGLARKGFERCRAFTWERTARATIESYRRALALP